MLHSGLYGPIYYTELLVPSIKCVIETVTTPLQNTRLSPFNDLLGRPHPPVTLGVLARNVLCGGVGGS